MILVLMGVTGSGKTTVGNLLAKKLHLPFYDADDFHSPANLNKMESGVPLLDADRMPWLETLSSLLQKSSLDKGCVLACSALKEMYRTIMQQGLTEKINWIHLEGPPEIIKKRLAGRTGHFMSPALLGSQFDILEKPMDALPISIVEPPEKIVDKIIQTLKLKI